MLVDTHTSKMTKPRVPKMTPEKMSELIKKLREEEE